MRMMLVLAMAAALGAPAAAETAATPAPASWTEQHQAMGYLVMHLSAINAINGLNLTRDQAVRLRDLAREVEAAGARAPDLGAAYRPDLAWVRDAYLEVRRMLLAGGEADDALRRRVAEARRVQSLVARLSLLQTPAGGTGCAKCHAEPDVRDVRPPAVGRGAEDRDVAIPWPQREVFLAHQVGVFGPQATLRLAAIASQVDRILTDAQKEGLRGFTCCLLPPKDLADPVRIGQADGGEATVEILRHVRGVAAAQWPATRERLLDRLDAILVLLQPGATDERKTAARRTVSAIYDEARSLSALDFEATKDDLARRLGRVTKAEKDLTDRQHAYMRATFLLVPGAAEAYDGLIRRLDASR